MDFMGFLARQLLPVIVVMSCTLGLQGLYQLNYNLAGVCFLFALMMGCASRAAWLVYLRKSGNKRWMILALVAFVAFQVASLILITLQAQ